jgi:CBS domain-containing protein
MQAKDLLSTEFVSIDKNEHISKLIGMLRNTHEKAAIIFDKEKFIGVSTKHLLLKTRFDPSEMKVAHTVLKVPRLSGEEQLSEVARLMFTSSSPVLPVISKNKLLGVIKLKDVIYAFRDNAIASRRIKDIPLTILITLNTGDPVGKAINIMKEKHISRLPIVDKRGNITGILSLTDILEKYDMFMQKRSEGHGTRMQESNTKPEKAFAGNKPHFASYPVDSIASAEIITSDKNDTLKSVIDKIKEHDFSSVIVVDREKPYGIITARDLLKLFIGIV